MLRSGLPGSAPGKCYTADGPAGSADGRKALAKKAFPPESWGEIPASVLTVAEMYRADAAAIAAGIPGDTLMQSAGLAVVEEICKRYHPMPCMVLCGPGNNGGDGFVIARLLKERGWPVRLALLGSPERLKGDAALNAARWEGEVEPLNPAVLDRQKLVIDALFGAGLARALDGQARATVEALAASGIPCVSVDMPSGVHGDTGGIYAVAPRAALTVTFFRSKPGHWLMPGRGCCGEVVVRDIGIPTSVLAAIAPSAFENKPRFWGGDFPWPTAADHKYSRGHALIVAGGGMPGAGRLAVKAARRTGVGVVTATAPAAVVPMFQFDSPGALVEPLEDIPAFQAMLHTRKRTAVLVGPGNGVSVPTGERVMAALKSGLACVLDADALSVFASDPQVLFRTIRTAGPCILTPHEGEFSRLFNVKGDKMMRARAAARQSGAVVILKGADTVIAEPGGRVLLNGNAPADLATAGSGDVLAGIAIGLLAQGVPAFAAAGMAVWLHGEAGRAAGPGLIAEDLPDKLPVILKKLKPFLQSDGSGT